jgi:hypothetical protein
MDLIVDVLQRFMRQGYSLVCPSSIPFYLFEAGREPPAQVAKASGWRAGGGETAVNAKLTPRGKDARRREMGREGQA